jgi:hypothetical protein
MVLPPARSKFVIFEGPHFLGSLVILASTSDDGLHRATAQRPIHYPDGFEFDLLRRGLRSQQLIEPVTQLVLMIGLRQPRQIELSAFGQFGVTGREQDRQ